MPFELTKEKPHVGRPDRTPTRIDRVEPTPMRIDELPPFSLAVAELMRFDPQVRIGLGARNGLLLGAEVRATGDDARARAWVESQWQALWQRSAHTLLRAKLYGFQPLEVQFRRAVSGPFAGLVEVAKLIDVPPAEARLLMRGDEIVGFERHAARSLSCSSTHDLSTSNAPPPPRTLLAPHGLVVTFDAECSNPYGCALLARAYPAWFEKWMPGGAKRTLRLRMIKDAYVGDILWFPADRIVQLPSGQEVSWRDLAREVVESRATGGAITLPMLRDATGQKLIDYTPPQSTDGHTQIFDWKRDLDLEIWKALEVPPEVIQASSPGSGYSGRWIPFAVALAAVHQELVELVQCVDRDLLRPLAHLNFGRPPEYTIAPRSLVETYAGMLGSGAP